MPRVRQRFSRGHKTGSDSVLPVFGRGNSLVPHRHPFRRRGLDSMIRVNWGRLVFLRHGPLGRIL